jgi:hypothetical protein
MVSYPASSFILVMDRSRMLNHKQFFVVKLSDSSIVDTISIANKKVSIILKNGFYSIFDTNNGLPQKVEFSLGRKDEFHFGQRTGIGVVDIRDCSVSTDDDYKEILVPMEGWEIVIWTDTGTAFFYLTTESNNPVFIFKRKCSN